MARLSPVHLSNCEFVRERAVIRIRIPGGGSARKHGFKYAVHELLSYREGQIPNPASTGSQVMLTVNYFIEQH